MLRRDLLVAGGSAFLAGHANARAHPAGAVELSLNTGNVMEGSDLVERAVMAFNANDAESFAAVFADDGVMVEYPDRVVARGRDAVQLYIGGLFTAFPGAMVELIHRADLGRRQITHERFDRKDGSAPYEAGLIYSLSERGVERMDFVREVRST